VNIRLAIARGVHRELDGRRRYRGLELRAALRRERMGVHDRLAPVQLLEHRREIGMAEVLPVVAHDEVDAVGLQRVHRVLDLPQAALDVGQGQGGEEPEAAGVVARERRRVLVRDPRQPAGERDVAQPRIGIDEGGHRGRDAALVHVLERALDRPRRVAAHALLERGGVGGRRDVVVHVYASRRRSGFHRRAAGKKRARAQRGDAPEESPPSRAVAGLRLRRPGFRGDDLHSCPPVFWILPMVRGGPARVKRARRCRCGMMP
jgi:hypothetical protein